MVPELVIKHIVVPSVDPIALTAFLAKLEFEGIFFSWKKLTHSLFKALQALLRIYFKVLSF